MKKILASLLVGGFIACAAPAFAYQGIIMITISISTNGVMMLLKIIGHNLKLQV